ncbi:MAG: NAD(P)H-dependent glycerol-3-phosphate dehydrogenase [Clostridia bacterium]
MKISVLGLGAYGIALAKVLNENGNEVNIWTKFSEEADVVSLKRENKAVLPGVKLPKDVKIYTDLKECIKKSQIIFIVVPTSAVRGVSKELVSLITDDQIICIAAKGIEINTNMLMSEVLKEEIKTDNVCVISGPSFAIELANSKEIGFMLASKKDSISLAVKVCLENENIKVETTSDIIGIQVGGSVKNVFAIIMGMLDGMKKSDSTKAAVLTRLVDDLRFTIEMLGGKSKTVFTYAGIGDMLLTCMSSKSRNYTFGKNIGKGMCASKALEQMSVKTVEGLYTLDSIYNLLKEKQIEVKSIKTLYSIIHGNMRVENVLNEI